MSWIHTATIVFHVLLAAGIIGLVLLQRGKGADAGAGFGAGASGTVFGARGSASFMTRMTATLSALFIATSLFLAYLGGQTPDAPKSVIDRVQSSQGSRTTEGSRPAGQSPDEPRVPGASSGTSEDLPALPTSGGGDSGN